MQDIIEIKQNLDKKLIRIGIILSNYCNYKCWYCWPEANAGTIKYPDAKKLIPNLAHLLDYYKKNAGKTKFDFNLAGGEPTNWKEFIPFVSYFKEHYGVKMTVHTNGSRKLDWWEKAYPYLDNVSISVHHEFADAQHIKEVADFLHSKKVPVYTQVLMDPQAWDKCMSLVEELKTSKYHWSIRYNEVIHPTLSYTEEQKRVVNSVRARGQKWWWFLLYNRSYHVNTVLVKENGTYEHVSENHILINKLNNFKGWQCNLGIDWINIASTGHITGYCPNQIYNTDTVYNLFDSDFKEKFDPVIAPVICEQNSCICVLDTNMPKKKVSNINYKKVITIHAI